MTTNQKENLLKSTPSQKTPRQKSGPGIISFNPQQYNRINNIQEKMGRDWMLYSETTNSLFCYCCCLFSTIGTKKNVSPWLNFGAIGFNDFPHQSRAISEHEKSQLHFLSIITWRQYQKSVKAGSSVKQLIFGEQQAEINHWRTVLHCIIDAILFLAKNNLAFRGTTSQINSGNSGNFLSLIQLMSKYSPPLALHVSRLKSYSTSYLSPMIQNEFIELTGTTVRNEILKNIRDRKFFSIMFDATPDVSHQEQISQIIRTVRISDEGCSIEENFIRFIQFDGKTGLLLSEMILDTLKTDNLEFSYCRGQGYDNGANMAGIYQGVQARIREINSLAAFIPCAAHSLNLVGVNAVNRVSSAKLLLGQIQNLYLFFSGSPNRWSVLKKHVKKTLKGQSNTRWSAKSDAVTALYEEYEGVIEALTEILNSEEVNASTFADADSQFSQIYNFKFVLGLTVWNFVLGRIQIVNLVLQNKNISVDEAAKHLSGLLSWLEEFKENGFQKSFEKAKLKSELLGLDTNSGFYYRKTRGRRPARFVDGNSTQILSNEEQFKVEFFDKVMNELIQEMQNRFENLRQTSEEFSFLWGMKLNVSKTEDLQNCVKDIVLKYDKDFDCQAFHKEMDYFKSAVVSFLDKPLEKTTPLDILNTLTQNNLQQQFVNSHTALRIFLTLPVTVATNERSFSKLKLIKTYLRSSMAQERLSDLSILSIERSYVESMSFDKVIDDFAASKCRRVQIV